MEEVHIIALIVKNNMYFFIIHDIIKLINFKGVCLWKINLI